MVTATAGATANVATYTVPVARKFHAYCIDLWGMVTTALAAGQGGFIQLVYVLPGPVNIIGPQRAFPAASAIGVSETIQGLQMYLSAGDVITLQLAIGEKLWPAVQRDKRPPEDLSGLWVSLRANIDDAVNVLTPPKEG